MKVVVLLASRHFNEIPWSSAIALLAVMFVGFAYLNADRWLAAQWLRPAEFALYSFAWILLLIAQSLQSLINASFFPLLARRFASAGSSAAFGLCARSSIGLLLLCAIFSWPAGIILNALVLHWFPLYANSMSVISIFLWVAVLRISDFWASLFDYAWVRKTPPIGVSCGGISCVQWLDVQGSTMEKRSHWYW